MFSALGGSLRLLGTRDKITVGLLAVLTLMLNGLDIAAISLVGLIGAVALGETDLRLLGWIPEGASEYETIFFLLGLAAGLFTLKTVAGILLARAREFFLASLETQFSAKIARNIFFGGLKAVKAYSRADMEWAILRSTRIAFGQIIGLSLVLFAEVSLAIAIMVLFVVVDWKSALLVSAYFAAILTAFHFSSRHSTRKTGKGYASGSVSVGQGITDLIGAYKESFVLGRLEFFTDRISLARNLVANSQARQTYLQAIPRLLVELGLIVGAIGFLIFQFAINNSEPDFGVISIFIVGSLRMMSALLPIQRSFMQLRFEAPQASAAQTMLMSAQSKQAGVVAPLTSAEKRINAPGPLSIHLEDVSFSYSDRDNNRPVLEKINLRVASGQTVALIGPSGSGKSTLIDLILGIQEPTSGTVWCSGNAPSRIVENNPGLIGYVPQKPGLVSGSIRENIALGIPPNQVDEEALWHAIDSAEIRDFIESLPQGVDSDIGTHADSLSGGQTQRIGLARALYSHPKLLVLDEATSALDAETESSISRSLKSNSAGRTTVIVAHRLSTIQDADRIFVLADGRIIGSGSLEELRNTVPLVERYIALMALK